MSVAARKLAGDVLRCPKCGKAVDGELCCGHCGSRLSVEQGRLFHIAQSRLKALKSGGNVGYVSTHEEDDQDEPESHILPISTSRSNGGGGGVGRISPALHQSPVNHERYTPPKLIALVHKALHQIDLDPASSKEANKVIKAKTFFTKETDGLKQKWSGRVFLNPPFDDWPTWMSKLDREIESGRVKQAIMVGPANISAYRPLLKRKGLLFIPNERPKYYDPHSATTIDPPFGSLICYVGNAANRFAQVFRKEGIVLRAL